MANFGPLLLQNVSHIADNELISCHTLFVDVSPVHIPCHSSLFITVIYTVTVTNWV
jgi:hypothetical protein